MRSGRKDGRKGKRTDGRRLGDLFRDEKGAAMAETVIMLPVFILVWACIDYMHGGFQRAVHNATEVREQVWAQAITGCQGGGAGGGRVQITQGSYSPSGGQMQSADMTGRTAVMWLPSANRAWPGIQFDEVEAEGTYQFDKPRLLGGNAEVRHNIAVTCNELPNNDVTFDQLALEAWMIFGIGGGMASGAMGGVGGMAGAGGGLSGLTDALGSGVVSGLAGVVGGNGVLSGLVDAAGGAGAFSGLVSALGGVGGFSDLVDALGGAAGLESLLGSMGGDGLTGLLGAIGGVGGLEGLLGAVGGMGGLEGLLGAVGGMGGLEGLLGAVGGMGGLEGLLGAVGGMGGLEDLLGAVGGMGGLEDLLGAVGGLDGLQGLIGAVGGIDELSALVETLGGDLAGAGLDELAGALGLSPQDAVDAIADATGLDEAEIAGRSLEEIARMAGMTPGEVAEMVANEASR